MTSTKRKAEGEIETKAEKKAKTETDEWAVVTRVGEEGQFADVWVVPCDEDYDFIVEFEKRKAAAETQAAILGPYVPGRPNSAEEKERRWNIFRSRWNKYGVLKGGSMPTRGKNIVAVHFITTYDEEKEEA